MLILCTFQWTEWDFPVFPTPKAVADLWPKLRWCSRTTNYAEACWLKTLLKTCSCCQMWLMHGSERLHAVGEHPLLIAAVLPETHAPLPLAYQLAVVGSPFPPHCSWREPGNVLPVLLQENHLGKHKPLGLSETQLSVSEINSGILTWLLSLAELRGCGPKQEALTDNRGRCLPKT